VPTVPQHLAYAAHLSDVSFLPRRDPKPQSSTFHFEVD